MQCSAQLTPLEGSQWNAVATKHQSQFWIDRDNRHPAASLSDQEDNFGLECHACADTSHFLFASEAKKAQ